MKTPSRKLVTLQSFFEKKRKSLEASSSATTLSTQDETNEIQEIHNEPLPERRTSEDKIELDEPFPKSLQGDENMYDVSLLPHDPGLRRAITTYHVNEQNAVRRAYILRGPCQPRLINFPTTKFGTKLRKFNAQWYDKFFWLEYSVEKDAAFCLVCFLFKNDVATSFGIGEDLFGEEGFKNWKKVEKLIKHVGDIRSPHNLAFEKYESLKNPHRSIIQALEKQSDQTKAEYKARLTASLKCLRYLLRQGLAFRGHDESEDSSNRGNFLELLKWLADIDDNVGRIVLKNAPKNHQLVAPKIQKDIINACAKETIKVIMEDLGDECFAILADESSDVSQKEQMALCIRYVDSKGKVVERFVGIVHVSDTTALSLKSAVCCLLMEHSLSLSKVRGQGYDGSSNMSGEFNGLKTLILKESPSAYYIHCFAHQLQLTLVAVAKKNIECLAFFDSLALLLNVVGASCKRKEMLRERYAKRVSKAIEDGSLETGTGLNQELGLSRPGDTRWGSHHKSILSVISLYPDIIDVLCRMASISSDDQAKAQGCLFKVESFDFIFMAHLMLAIFGYTRELSLTLQKKDLDIVNAMSLVKMTKLQFQNMRNDGWETFFPKVLDYCSQHKIEVPDMNATYIPHGRSKRFAQQCTYLHHYQIEVFLAVIDLQLQEFNNRFDETNMELLTCMACLSPVDSFSSFDKQKVLRLSQLYQNDFTSFELLNFEYQLDNFIVDMREDIRFSNLKDLGQLSMKLVETSKHLIYSDVYKLLKLVLVLPVATASVERGFSAMTFVKSKLRNSIGDQFLNDCLVTFIEKDVFLQVSDDVIIDHFQNMKTQRGQL